MSQCLNAEWETLQQLWSCVCGRLCGRLWWCLCVCPQWVRRWSWTSSALRSSSLSRPSSVISRTLLHRVLVGLVELSWVKDQTAAARFQLPPRPPHTARPVDRPRTPVDRTQTPVRWCDMSLTAGHWLETVNVILFPQTVSSEQFLDVWREKETSRMSLKRRNKSKMIWLSLLFPLQMSLRSVSSPDQLRVYSLETTRTGSPVPPSLTSVPLTWSSCRRKTRRPSGVSLIQTLNKKCHFYRSNNNRLINKCKISR